MQTIEKGALRPLYYLYGDEPFLMEKCVQRIVERLVPPDLRDFNLSIYYATEAKGDEIAETAATLPMFSPWRVVLVRKADALSSASLETLTAYLQRPSPSTCLIFQGEKIDQRKRFFLEMKKNGVLVEFRHLYENQLAAFVRNEASSRGKKIDAEAAELLVYLVGNNLQELVSELDKAILYAGGGTAIHADDIRSIVSDTRINSIFDLTDSLGDKKLDRALKSLDTLLQGGEAPLLVVAMITRHFRQLWKVRDLMDRKMPARDMGKAAGINPYFLQGIVRQAGNYPAAELRRVFEGLFELDLALKTGRGRPRVLLEQFMMIICGAGGVNPRRS